MKHNLIPLAGAVVALLLSGFLLSRAQDAADVTQHADCTFFTPGGDRSARSARRAAVGVDNFPHSRSTEEAVARLGFIPGGSRTQSFQDLDRLGTIDKHIFAELQANGVQPADQTTDFEFIRRVTLDLTGRIPTPERVTAFVADAAADKRAGLVDELLASPAWVDKWTMYFGDLFQNTVDKPSVNLRRFQPGRNVFWKWIKDSLAANKPYDRMARELISAEGQNSYTDGAVNWLVGGWVINNPEHDNWDQQAANIAETFLGLGHMNCVLCHNGRGHLDQLSVWGRSATRTQAWGFASFLSRTTLRRVPLDPADNNTYYWRIADAAARLGDYPLNTTTGNRPPRQPAGALRNVTPVYPFNGHAPNSGENYRVAMGREVTSDFQFARAAVNYIWKEFFTLGIVEPANQFDPARLDPDHPPTALRTDGTPWTLQPSNARLLNALAQDFIDSGYDLRALMRAIAKSETYQLSARYNGQWKPEWEKLFARKLARRLWAEEVHDAIAQSSGVPVSYNVDGFSSWNQRSPFQAFPVYGNVASAMQLPDVIAMTGVGANGFLDSFIRGNRDTEDRRSEGSLLQALNLMNDTLVTTRIRRTNPASSLIARALTLPDADLVKTLYLTVLSRYPSDVEMQTALNSLQQGVRGTRAENLLWSLYNKVDFFINY